MRTIAINSAMDDVGTATFVAQCAAGAVLNAADHVNSAPWRRRPSVPGLLRWKPDA